MNHIERWNALIDNQVEFRKYLKSVLAALIPGPPGGAYDASEMIGIEGLLDLKIEADSAPGMLGEMVEEVSNLPDDAPQGALRYVREENSIYIHEGEGWTLAELEDVECTACGSKGRLVPWATDPSKGPLLCVRCVHIKCPSCGARGAVVPLTANLSKGNLQCSICYFQFQRDEKYDLPDGGVR